MIGLTRDGKPIDVSECDRCCYRCDHGDMGQDGCGECNLLYYEDDGSNLMVSYHDVCELFIVGRY